MNAPATMKIPGGFLATALNAKVNTLPPFFLPAENQLILPESSTCILLDLDILCATRYIIALLIYAFCLAREPWQLHWSKSDMYRDAVEVSL